MPQPPNEKGGVRGPASQNRSAHLDSKPGKSTAVANRAQQISSPASATYSRMFHATKARLLLRLAGAADDSEDRAAITQQAHIHLVAARMAEVVRP